MLGQYKIKLHAHDQIQATRTPWEYRIKVALFEVPLRIIHSPVDTELFIKTSQLDNKETIVKYINSSRYANVDGFEML